MSALYRQRVVQFWVILLLTMIGMIAALVTANLARASVIFHYDSACAPVPCPDVGLGVGDPVSGLFEFADGAIAPNAFVSQADIVGFALDFGTIDIDVASAFGFAFAGVLDATGNGFAEFMMSVGNSFEIPGGLILLDVIGWAAGAGACLSADCSDFFIINGAFGLGATIARADEVPDPLPLPVPSTALLALVPLATVLRRMRARTRA